MKNKNSINDVQKFLKNINLENYEISKKLYPLYIIRVEDILILFDVDKQTISISFEVSYNPEQAAKIAIEFSKYFKKLTIKEDHFYKKDDILMGKEAFNEMFKKVQSKITKNFMKSNIEEQMLADNRIGFHC